MKSMRFMMCYHEGFLDEPVVGLCIKILLLYNDNNSESS